MDTKGVRSNDQFLHNIGLDLSGVSPESPVIEESPSGRFRRIWPDKYNWIKDLLKDIDDINDCD